jgi:hypothetical protein
MKTKFAFLIALGTVCLILGLDPASALTKKGAVNAGAVNANVQRNKKLMLLTKGECTKFGGTVSANVACKSKSMCETTDENGVTHRVCISAKKQ